MSNSNVGSERTRADITRQIVTLLLILAATVVANVLGATLGATDTGNIANEQFGDSVFFFPASYVFGTIWPVIYLGILGLAIHQALPSQATNPRYRRGDIILAINLVLNGGWVAIFGVRLYILSLITIVPILVTAILAYKRLAVARTPDAGTAENVLKTSVGIYTAWLTVAVVANVSLALDSVGWSGFGATPETWGLIITIVGIGLGLTMLLLFRDAAFPAVYAYAYLGIYARQQGVVQPVAVAALVGTVLFGVIFLYLVVRAVLARRK